MHSHEEHKSLHTKRVGRMLKGYARGGAAHADEAQDKKLIKRMMHKHDAELHGHKPKGRGDKFARGGRAKGGGKTHIAVNVMPQSQPPQRVPVPVPVPGGAPPMRPPMPGGMPPGAPGAAPGGMPPGGPPGMPPGMPMRKSGGRIKDGPAWKEGMRHGTKVQHVPGKDHSDNLHKPYPVTRATGGRADFGDKMKTAVMARSGGSSEGGRGAKGNFGEKMRQPDIMHGSAGGLGRLEKIKLERKSAR